MDLKQYSDQFDKAIEHYKTDINSIRTNRATPALLENIQVEVYGSKMPLIQLASIQAPEPKTLTIEPWDKQIIKDIEKAIQTSSLGLSLVSQGNFLRVSIPSLTEESRRDLIKALNYKTEKARQSIRGTRDYIKDEINSAEKNKEISQDEKYQLLKDLDDMTRQFMEQAEQIESKKIDEIKF